MLVIKKQLSPHILELTLNRPEKKNALSIDLMKAFLSEIKNIEEKVRVVIIRGNGPFFCSGLDLSEVANPALSDESSALISEVFFTLNALPQVTILEIIGGALAGGMGIVAAVDLIVAENEAIFALPELKRGLRAPLVHALLKSQVSPRHLKELILTGESINAKRAEMIGLINYAVKREEIDAVLKNLIESVLKNAPMTTRDYKKALLEEFEDEIDLKEITKTHLVMRSTDEAIEGTKAFIEKRAPRWVLNS